MLLTVDADVVFLQAVERVLNVKTGVLLARNAEQALSLLRSVGSTFSVALVNSELLTHDGLSLILRHEYLNLPVIAITSAMREQVFEAANGLGDASVVRKPITPELKAAIARLRETSGDRK